MTTELDDFELEEIDFSWIDEFEPYKHYYLQDVETIHVHCAYLNQNQEIIKMNQEQIVLQNPNILSKEELSNIINKNNFLNDKKYILFSILKFNIDILPTHLHNFLEKNNPNNYDFLHIVENIDSSIEFKKCIGMFHDLNEITLFFQEFQEGPAKKKHKYTKRFLMNKLAKHRKTKKFPQAFKKTT